MLLELIDLNSHSVVEVKCDNRNLVKKKRITKECLKSKEMIIKSLEMTQWQNRKQMWNQ